MHLEPLARSYDEWGGLFGSDLVFCRVGRMVFWPRQGQRDRGAGEVEGLALFAGGLGKNRDGDLGVCEADLISGQGGQVLEQVRKLRPAGSRWPAALAWAAGERRAGQA